MDHLAQHDVVMYDIVALRDKTHRRRRRIRQLSVARTVRGRSHKARAHTYTNDNSVSVGQRNWRNLSQGSDTHADPRDLVPRAAMAIPPKSIAPRGTWCAGSLNAIKRS